MVRSFALLLVAAAVALTPAANARSKPKPGLPAAAHKARGAHGAVRAAPKDPYADYWHDPSRQGFPSWGLTGN
jgi:hypothetical protein